ncbi:MAG: Por secretion system C-terminal sorting protein, partial [Bacteroidetes bacterium]|nr:Por secretion system C-terminal sorting protein [Bacteroidota bacterium]
ASDLYNATSTTITFSGGNAQLNVNLPAYGIAVYVIDVVQRTVVLPPLVGVKENDNLPTETYLDQNYPNPFNPSTSIGFHITENASVSLRVYDILGREIETLVNEQLPLGSYTVNWDGRNSSGTQVGSGMYFYRLQTNGHTIVKRMLLLR